MSLIVKVVLSFLLEKQQKNPKQSTGVAGGKVKRKSNERDSSEDAKKQGAKQKTKSNRGIQREVEIFIFLVLCS